MLRSTRHVPLSYYSLLPVVVEQELPVEMTQVSPTLRTARTAQSSCARLDALRLKRSARFILLCEELRRCQGENFFFYDDVFAL